MSAIASLFTGSDLGLSFEERVIKHARAGRVNHQLRELALGIDGVEIPADKPGFISFINDIGGAEQPGFPVARARAYWGAFLLILSEMGETMPAMPAWFPKKAAAPKAAAIAASAAPKAAPKTAAIAASAAPKAAPKTAAIAVSAVLTAIAAGLLTEEELASLRQALEVAPVTA